MRADWVIIDGYSLLYRRRAAGHAASRALETERDLLVREVEAAAGWLADRVTMVFDGRQAGGSADGSSAAVEILFSPPDKTADTVIERLVHAAPRPEGVLVVTSDRRERDTVSAAGAQTISCGDFLARCAELRAVRPAPAREPRGGRATLGDFFPK